MRSQQQNSAVCPDCGAPGKIVREDYRFTESGLKNVVLKNIEVIRCGKCGDAPILPAPGKLMRVIALTIATKPNPLNGEEFRFLRKFIGKSQDELSDIIPVHKTTISKWENNEDPIGDQSDRLIRVVAMALGGLKQDMPEVIERFHSIHAGKSRSIMSVDVISGKGEYAAA